MSCVRKAASRLASSSLALLATAKRHPSCSALVALEQSLGLAQQIRVSLGSEMIV